MIPRLAVLVSGGGTTLQNLLDRIADRSLPAAIAVVIANDPAAFGLQRAAAAGIPTEVIPFPRQAGAAPAANPAGDPFAAPSAAVFDRCRRERVDLVVLAGFLKLLRIPPDFVGRVMNIHPSLIPSFCGHGLYGLRVHQAALDRGVKISGCTVHFVDDQYDHGPIILQRAVPVHDDDTPVTLAARVFAAECIAYPEAIRLFAADRLRRHGPRIQLLPAPD